MAALGAIREFGEALANGPYRVALVISVLLHLLLLLTVGGGTSAPPSRPPVRLHFVREMLAPPVEAPPANRVTAPAAPQAVPREKKTLPAGPAQVPPVDSPVAPSPALTPEAAAPDPAPILPVAIPQTDVGSPPPETSPAALMETAPPQPAKMAEAVYEAKPSSAVASFQESQSDQATTPLRSAGAGESPSAAVGSTATVTPAETPGGRDGLAKSGAGLTTGGGAPGAGGVGRTGDAPGGLAAGEASAPAAAGAGGNGFGPSAQDIASLRRRIDARKVYPPIAVRNGWEGRVLVEMHLELDGRLAAVRLVAGSGYSILDEATITAVRLASPFPPIARVVTVPVEYRLTP